LFVYRRLIVLIVVDCGWIWQKLGLGDKISNDVRCHNWLLKHRWTAHGNGLLSVPQRLFH